MHWKHFSTSFESITFCLKTDTNKDRGVKCNVWKLCVILEPKIKKLCVFKVFEYIIYTFKIQIFMFHYDTTSDCKHNLTKADDSRWLPKVLTQKVWQSKRNNLDVWCQHFFHEQKSRSIQNKTILFNSCSNKGYNAHCFLQNARKKEEIELTNTPPFTSKGTHNCARYMYVIQWCS